MAVTYEITKTKGGEPTGIRCLECNMVSWNENDVREKYCGNCHEFHEQKQRKIDHPEWFK